MTNSQDALHAALRKAYEDAAMKLFPDGFDTEFRMLAARAVAEKIIEQELTPVVEALVGAAYKACAAIARKQRIHDAMCGDVRLPDFGETIATEIESLTPESAARALRASELAARIKALKEVETFIAGNGRNADIQTFVEKLICTEDALCKQCHKPKRYAFHSCCARCQLDNFWRALEQESR